MDIEKTTYHETDEGIWRIDSGVDYGEVWELDVFKEHAEDYGDEDPRRESEGSLEILESEFESREYRLIKNHDTGKFYFMFYQETNAEDPRSYVDKIWMDEINTILSETARAKIELRHELEESEDNYKRRLSDTI